MCIYIIIYINIYVCIKIYIYIYVYIFMNMYNIYSVFLRVKQNHKAIQFVVIYKIALLK